MTALMRTRLVTPAAALLALGALAPGLLPSAAAKELPPQIADAKGDATGGQAGTDVVSVRYSTTGTGTGKKYVPKKLIVTLTLAAPPMSQGVTNYTVKSDTDACGVIEFRYAPGTVLGGLIGDTTATYGSCNIDDDSTAFFSAKVKGNDVTFETSLKALDMDRGTEFSDFVVAVDPGEPVGAGFAIENGTIDAGSGDGTWFVP